jgi:hypothetical protein
MSWKGCGRKRLRTNASNACEIPYTTCCRNFFMKNVLFMYRLKMNNNEEKNSAQYYTVASWCTSHVVLISSTVNFLQATHFKSFSLHISTKKWSSPIVKSWKHKEHNTARGNTHMRTRGTIQQLSISAERQQFPHPQLLTLDDNHFWSKHVAKNF